MGSDGGGSQSSTSYQNAIQPELMPYAMRMLGSASDMVYKNPIQQYTGQTTAGFSPLQQQAMGNLQQMQPSAYLSQGANLAGMAGTNQFTGANVNQYMSPYINDVIRNQQQGAIRNYATQLPTMAAGATRAGGLGGSRSAIMESEAQSNLQNQLQGIQSSGLQNAYQNAQQQFNMANQNQLAAANALGNFGQQQYAQSTGINQALMNAGALQQAQEQNALNASMQKFQNAQIEPYQRLNFLSSLIRGVPVQSMGQTMTPATPSTASQIAGLGMGIYGMNQAFGQNKAEGGEIKGYAGGGIVSLASGGSTTEKMGAINARMEQLKQANPSMPMNQVNAQIQQETQAIPNSIPWQNAAALLAYNKTHPAVAAPPPPDTVVVQMAKQIAQQDQAKKMAEAQGIAGLPTPNVGQNYTPNGITAQPQEEQTEPQVNAAEGGGIADLQSDIGNNYAGGGIVAFAEGDLVRKDPMLRTPVDAFGNPISQMSMPSGVGTMTYQGAPEPTELERIEQIYNTPADYSTYASGYDPETLNLMYSDTLKNRYKTLKAEQKAKDEAARKVNAAGSITTDPEQVRLQQLAAGRGISIPTAGTNAPATTVTSPPPPPPSPPGDLGLASLLTRSNKGTAVKAISPVGIGDVSKVDLGVEKPQSVTEITDQMMSFRKEHGIGNAQKAMIDYLKEQDAQLADNSKFNRGMLIANAGFKIATTPGGLLQGLGAGGAEFSQNMVALKKEENAARAANKQAMLQAQVALEKGDEDVLKSALEMQEKQKDRYATSIFQQASLTQQAFGNSINLMQARNTAAYQQGSLANQAAALESARVKSTLENAYIEAVKLGDVAKQQTILDKIEALNRASSAYMLGETKNAAAVGAQVQKDATVQQMYASWLNAKTPADKQKYAELYNKAMEDAKARIMSGMSGGIGGLNTAETSLGGDADLGVKV